MTYFVQPLAVAVNSWRPTSRLLPTTRWRRPANGRTLAGLMDRRVLVSLLVAPAPAQPAGWRGRRRHPSTYRYVRAQAQLTRQFLKLLKSHLWNILSISARKLVNLHDCWNSKKFVHSLMLKSIGHKFVKIVSNYSQTFCISNSLCGRGGRNLPMWLK